jgi:hypothetical protein
MSIRPSDTVSIDSAGPRLIELAEDVVAGAEKVLTKNGHPYVAIIDARKLDYYQALEVEYGRLVLLDDAMKGLQDVAARRIVSERAFRHSLRPSESSKSGG